MNAREVRLRERLEEMHARWHRPEYLATDPVWFAHQYRRNEDREVAALVAAAFSSGNIVSIQALLSKLLGVMGKRPARWLKEHEPKDLRGAFPGVYHRWVREEDIEVFCALLGVALRRHGTLGGLWRFIDDAAEPTTFPALERFTSAILEEPVEPLVSRSRQARRDDGRISPLASIESILLTRPARGSSCKRMHLFLRWMARPADGIDLGLWSDFLSPARLVMPVDTHVLRICRELKLTRQKAATRRAAEEITTRLARLNPGDPCRYDFALVRAGIGDAGLRRRRQGG